MTGRSARSETRSFKAVITWKGIGNPGAFYCSASESAGWASSPGLDAKISKAGVARALRPVNEMKKIGQIRGWVVPHKERRVLKLLLMYTRECEHEFVINSPSVPAKRVVRIKVEFAPEELSEFEVSVQVVVPPGRPTH